MLKREMEDGVGDPLAPPPAIPMIEEAVEKFLADAEHGRKLTRATIKKYKVALTQLKAFAAERPRFSFRNSP